MRAILESYDSELTPAEHSPQLSRRMREAEDMVQKLHAHNTELEAQLSQVLEEVGNHKQRAEMMSNQSGHVIPGDVPAVDFAKVSSTGSSSISVVEELSCIRAITNFQCHTALVLILGHPKRPQITTADSSPVCAPLSPEKGAVIYLWLEVEMKVLKSQQCTVEPSTVITKEEVDTLRLKIEELEAERSKLAEENRSLEMKLEKFTQQGDYDPSRTKVVHFSMNPMSLAKQQRKEEQQQLQEECERLRELVRVLKGGGSISGNLEGVGGFQSPQEVAELKKQVESAELKNQRLKEVFQTKIQEFRKVCYTLTGYQIDITTENQYRLSSIYAEHQGDCLLFKRECGAHHFEKILGYAIVNVCNLSGVRFLYFLRKKCSDFLIIRA
ncbi:hypothetical protein DUI87_05325 [Hirundo rustica rustica]|uniref:Mitotic spindle assembly checkpoint protein MAD1 n=1 Tax=Hirundo rustica rustica TaxID=333673 RepID=A0A3M0KY84_HIRRU|nr:hypothetical protein DUI87_05325 [Hirundo rustica rustica]